ncbi:MAG: hypothetical protein ACRDRJ_27935 [Streptosporangiaceae bacterium]
MTFPPGLPVIDTMIGFPHEGFAHEGFAQYDFIRRQTRDRSSREEMEFPVEYIFTGVPKDLPTDDPNAVTLGEMGKYGIERGLVGVSDETSRAALKAHPDRFIPSGAVPDPNDDTGSVRALRREFADYGIRATSVFPSGTFPQVPIDDPKMYPPATSPWACPWSASSATCPACRSRTRSGPGSCTRTPAACSSWIPRRSPVDPL